MKTGKLFSGECGPWTRAIALVLSVGILAIQFPLPALAQPLSDSCGPEAELLQADTCCDGEISCDSPAEQQEDAPDDEPCCPNSCTHCPLPCCTGMPLSSNLPETTVVQAVAAETFIQSSFLPSSIELGRIFHPPRS